MTERDVVVAQTLAEPATTIIRRYATSRTTITCEGRPLWGLDHIPAGARLTIRDDGLGQTKVVETLIAALSGHEIQSYREYRIVEIMNADGIHTRPAMKLIDTCTQFMSELVIEADGICVDGKSIIQMSMLPGWCGQRLGLNAYGPDARELVDALKQLIEVRHFDEPMPGQS